ncbi:MAG: hypothetical protein GEU93_17420 [Propionibacteriales bacterium]|nr:hypothetical protein [Propionibacteriales bacterium]
MPSSAPLAVGLLLLACGSGLLWWCLLLRRRLSETARLLDRVSAAVAEVELVHRAREQLAETQQLVTRPTTRVVRGIHGLRARLTGVDEPAPDR